MATFTACSRNNPEVVVPAQATPREVKSLSDMDNQLLVRAYITFINFFRLVAPQPENLASRFKEALARSLVYYYPMAGRLRELPGGKKLVVDCTAEGAVFVEAHANVRLEELGKPLLKPHPCIEEFKCDVGDVGDVIGKPLLYLQMTQLRCRGVVVALTASHNLVDASGLYQIFKCITELVRGQALPTVLPTWERQLLVASSSPQEAEEATSSAMATTAPSPSPINDEAVVTRYFLFGPREIAALRAAVPAAATVFELITAAVWRCRVAALQYPPHQRVRLYFIVNGRGAWKQDPPLPPGFYGNAGFFSTVEADAAELCGGPLEHVVRLVRQARLRFTDHHVRSYLDMMARGDNSHSHEGAPEWSSFSVSDVSRLVRLLDIGSWAEHVAGGPAFPVEMLRTTTSVYTSCKDTNGEECVLVPMGLPELAMERFTAQIATVTSMFARSTM